MSGEEGHADTLMAAGGAVVGSLRPGSHLNDTYEILGHLFEGGMGDIYEARHLRLTGRFAVKVLRKDITANNPSVFDRFRREAEVTSSLRHPHIVQVVDFNRTPDGSAYFVMELLEGQNLRLHLDQHGPLSLSDVAIIVEQVASALEAAHERGIVHRDLKPENIQLVPIPGRKEPFVKVLDFGISKVLTASTLTQESMLVGTPYYMAPEQARGGSDDLDGRTDQFALGAIAHELLTGKKVFDAEMVASIIYRVFHDEPESLVALAGESVDAAVRKALAKNRDERFSKVTDFAEALRQAVFGPSRGTVASLAGMPVVGHPPAERPFSANVQVKVQAKVQTNEAGPSGPASRVTSLPAQTGSITRSAPKRRFLAVTLGIVGAVAAVLVVGGLWKQTPSPIWVPAEGDAAGSGARLATLVRHLAEEETGRLTETIGRAAQVEHIANALTGRVDEATFQDLLANEAWWGDFRSFGTAVLVGDEAMVTWKLPATAGAPAALAKAVSKPGEKGAQAGWIIGASGALLAAVAPIEGVKDGRLLLVRALDRAFLTDLATRANAVLLLSDGHTILDVSVPENTLPEIALLVGKESSHVLVDKAHRRLAAVVSWSPTLWIWAVTGWTL